MTIWGPLKYNTNKSRNQHFYDSGTTIETGEKQLAIESVPTIMLYLTIKIVTGMTDFCPPQHSSRNQLSTIPQISSHDNWHPCALSVVQKSPWLRP